MKKQNWSQVSIIGSYSNRKTHKISQLLYLFGPKFSYGRKALQIDTKFDTVFLLKLDWQVISYVLNFFVFTTFSVGDRVSFAFRYRFMVAYLSI